MLSKGFWNMFSNGGIVIMIAVPVLIAMVDSDKRSRMLYYSFVLGLTNFTSGVLKFIYHDPRPFWTVSADADANI
jgi:ABC-type Mn2+/Zn2+ transport system permease subunit